MHPEAVRPVTTISVPANDCLRDPAMIAHWGRDS
jgi:hypothetical protein